MQKKTISLEKIDKVNPFAIQAESDCEKTARLCENWKYVHGQLRKRNGFCERKIFHRLDDPYQKINGLYPYNGKLMIHSKNVLYQMDLLGDQSVTRLNVNDLEAKQTKGLSFDGNKLLVLGSEKPMVLVNQTFSRLENHASAYVPLTTAGLRDLRIGASSTVQKRANFLARRRKNAFGTEPYRHTYTVVDSTYLPFQEGYYSERTDVYLPCITLDCPISRTSGDTDIEISFFSGEHTHLQAKVGAVDYTGNVFLKFRCYRSEYPSVGGSAVSTVAYSVKGEAGQTLTLYENETELTPSVTLTESLDTIAFNFYTDETTDNGLITFDAQEFTSLDNYTLGVRFGAGGKRILLSNGIDCIMTDGDDTYFEKRITLGQRAKDFLPLSENAVAVFYENGFSKLVFDGDQVVESQNVSSRGAINSFCTCHLGNDSLCFDGQNLYGLVQKSNEVTLTQNRAPKIEFQKLSSEQKSNAFCLVVPNGLYYAFGGELYFTSTELYSESTGTYEWFHQTVPMEISCGCVCYGQVVFGTTDGKIVLESDGYEDLQQEELSANDTLYHFDTQTLTVNAQLGLREGDRMMLGNHEIIVTDNAVVQNGKLHCPSNEFYRNGKVWLCEGDILHIRYALNGTYTDLTDYTITDLTDGTCDISVSGGNLPSANTVCQVTLKRGPREYALKAQGESFVFTEQGKTLRFSQRIVFARQSVTTRKSVCAKIVSPWFLLDRVTLCSVSLLLGVGGQHVSFGVETNQNRKFFQVKKGAGFSFRAMDFDALSFGKEERAFVVKRLFEKGVTQLRFVIESTDNRPCTPQKIQCTYFERS